MTVSDRFRPFRIVFGPIRQRRRKKKHLIEAAPFGRLDQMLRTIIYGGDTSYYDVESPWPSQVKGAKWPVDQKHDLNLTDLTLSLIHI